MRALVPDRLTPIVPEEAIEAYAQGHLRAMGSIPTASTLACLVAQSALEDGWWKSMHWYNFGNVKASPSWDGLYTMYRCNEVINGKVEWFDPPHPQTHFRAFPDSTTGALEQVAFLTTNDRYRGAWHAACAGDVHGFAMLLGQEGYYTADRTTYSHATESIAGRFLAGCASYLAGEGHSLTDADKSYIEALVYQTLEQARPTDPHELSPESVA